MALAVDLLHPGDGRQADGRPGGASRGNFQLSAGFTVCHSAYLPQQAWPTDRATCMQLSGRSRETSGGFDDREKEERLREREERTEQCGLWKKGQTYKKKGVGVTRCLSLPGERQP